ncbi:hypothetical protein [Rufibacter ruber]|uniref:hypothetical protein n=1 Tax=Rufibacter ruber TaxID=1783499 RepID=UPI00082F129A|nr:hypothetical protein [Rufibacter ruber]
MKNKNLYYALAAFALIVAVVLNLLHVASSSVLLGGAYVTGRLLMLWHARQLEKQLPQTVVASNKMGVQRMAALLILGVAVLHLMHWPFANHLLLIALGFDLWAQSRYLKKLEQQQPLEDTH